MPWVDCTNHVHDQDDVGKSALEDRFRVMYAEPAAEPTGLVAMMDDNNRAMARVFNEQGPEAAAKAMMDAAGGDYAEMRMMYG